MRSVVRSNRLASVQLATPVMSTATVCLATPMRRVCFLCHSYRSVCTYNTTPARTPNYNKNYRTNSHNSNHVCGPSGMYNASYTSQQRCYSHHSALFRSTQRPHQQHEQQHSALPPLTPSYSRASHVTMRGPLKDRYPPMAVDLDDPRRRLAVLIDGSSHTRLLQPVDRGLTHTRSSDSSSHGNVSLPTSPAMAHYGALFTHVLPALHEFGVPVLLRVFAYELSPEWARLIDGSVAEDGSDEGVQCGLSSASSSSSHSNTGKPNNRSSKDGPCSAEGAGAAPTRVGEQGGGNSHTDRMYESTVRQPHANPNSTIVRSVLTLPTPPSGDSMQSSATHKARDLAHDRGSSNGSGDKDEARANMRRSRGVNAMVEVEYFRVERFIPIPMQMEADAQHIHDFRAQNKIEGVCYVCTETDRAVYERVMAQQQQPQLQQVGTELSNLPESLRGRFCEPGKDLPAPFFNQYLFDELGVVKEINVDRRLGDGQ